MAAAHPFGTFVGF